jgi:hypothetical protein
MDHMNHFNGWGRGFYPFYSFDLRQWYIDLESLYMLSGTKEYLYLLMQ